MLIKTPSRIAKIAADVASHFREKVEPQGFKAQLVAYDKASCVAYKSELDKHLGPEASTIVMSKSRGTHSIGRSGPPVPTSWSRSSPDTTTRQTR